MAAGWGPQLKRNPLGRIKTMYSSVDDDTPVAVPGLPPMETGAPLPHLFADDQSLIVAYAVAEAVEGWDGSNASVVKPTDKVLAAVVRFVRPLAHYFGPPNDEAFTGHPLAARGLKPYQLFEVRSSSWLAELCRRNAVHPAHSDALFAGYRHFVLGCHDTMLECLAMGFQVKTERTSVKNALSRAVAAHDWDAA